jgi:hypothetical protein
MYLMGAIYNLNFAILIFNEIYLRNRGSIREPVGSKKLPLIGEFPGNTGELVTLLEPDEGYRICFRPTIQVQRIRKQWSLS